MTKASLQIPKKMVPLFTPQKGEVRYRLAYGGRGSGKTRTFALMAAVKAYELEMSGESGVILCAREFQNSLDESSLQEVKLAIKSVPWLDEFFTTGEKFIKTKTGRVKFVFSGLRHNLDSIKSKARILLCWIDEAEPVSEAAYRILLPTIREENSECWITWNPEREGSPTDMRFVKNTPEKSVIAKVNSVDNPWLPEALQFQREQDREHLDPATFSWIWEGEYLKNSDAQIFKDCIKVDSFSISPLWHGPYYGLDFGFSQDPTALLEVYYHRKTVYVSKEIGGIGLDLHKMVDLFLRFIPDLAEYTIRADNARPESISYLRQHGLPRIKAVKKWPGSVQDGITWLRSQSDIKVFPACEKFIKETQLYSYKVDRLSGDISTQIIDDNNHYIDALRYALEPLIKKNQIDYNKLSAF